MFRECVTLKSDSLIAKKHLYVINQLYIYSFLVVDYSI